MTIAWSRRPVQAERSGASMSASSSGSVRYVTSARSSAFGPDLQDPFDRRGVLWVAQQAAPSLGWVVAHGLADDGGDPSRPNAGAAVGAEATWPLNSCWSRRISAARSDGLIAPPGLI